MDIRLIDKKKTRAKRNKNTFKRLFMKFCKLKKGSVKVKSNKKK